MTTMLAADLPPRLLGIAQRFADMGVRPVFAHDDGEYLLWCEYEYLDGPYLRALDLPEDYPEDYYGGWDELGFAALVWRGRRFHRAMFSWDKSAYWEHLHTLRDVNSAVDWLASHDTGPRPEGEHVLDGIFWPGRGWMEEK